MTRIPFTLVVFALAALQSAQAVPAPDTQAGAASACKSALPVYDGALRTRPLAMANEGTTGAFVSCANVSDVFLTADAVIAYFRNTGTGPASISCTMLTHPLHNWGGYDRVTYFPKTLQLAAGGFEGVLWTKSDNGGNVFVGALRMSCNLPPKVELSYFRWGDIV